MVIVTGVGPRTGTSALMQHFTTISRRVSANPFINEDLTPSAGNPLGYYETDLSLLEAGLGANDVGQIFKVWPTHFHCVDWNYVDKVYCLYRTDRDEHIKSIASQMERENVHFKVTAREILNIAHNAWSVWYPNIKHKVQMIDRDDLTSFICKFDRRSL